MSWIWLGSLVISWSDLGEMMAESDKLERVRTKEMAISIGLPRHAKSEDLMS